MTEEKKKEQSDHAIVTFARSNPPHAGHIKLFNAMRKQAEASGADHHVFLSQSHDNKTNPLSHSQKVKMIHHMDPHINVHPASDAHTPIDMMKHLAKKGYKKVTVMVGSDRKKEFENLLHKYNGSEYKVNELHVKGIERDPDSHGTAGASSTKMREAAKSGNFKEFRKHVPKKEIARELYMATKNGLKEDNYTAMFILGGPGSGKDIILRETALRTVVELPLAKLYDAIMVKKNLDEVNGQALVVNGNADDFDRVNLCKRVLEAVGYKTGAIFVSVADSVSKAHNESRIAIGKKTITEETRKVKHAQSMRNVLLFKEAFDTFIVYNNSSEKVSLSEVEGSAALFFTGNNLDTQVEKLIAEARESEFDTNRALSQTARHEVVKKVGLTRNHNGMSNYYNHVNNTQVAKASAGATKEKSPPIRKPPGAVITTPTGNIRENLDRGFKKFISKGKGTKSKEASSPVDRYDSRNSDGMAMTATFAAEASTTPISEIASIVPKTIKKIREDVVPKSPELLDEPKRVFEDWGFDFAPREIDGEQILLHSPFKTNRGYAVFVENADQKLQLLEFTRKEGEPPRGVKIFETAFWETIK